MLKKELDTLKRIVLALVGVQDFNTNKIGASYHLLPASGDIHIYFLLCSKFHKKQQKIFNEHLCTKIKFPLTSSSS